MRPSRQVQSSYSVPQQLCRDLRTTTSTASSLEPDVPTILTLSGALNSAWHPACCTCSTHSAANNVAADLHGSGCLHLHASCLKCQHAVPAGTQRGRCASAWWRRLAALPASQRHPECSCSEKATRPTQVRHSQPSHLCPEKPVMLHADGSAGYFDRQRGLPSGDSGCVLQQVPAAPELFILTGSSNSGLVTTTACCQDDCSCATQAKAVAVARRLHCCVACRAPPGPPRRPPGPPGRGRPDGGPPGPPRLPQQLHHMQHPLPGQPPQLQGPPEQLPQMQRALPGQPPGPPPPQAMQVCSVICWQHFACHAMLAGQKSLGATNLQRNLLNLAFICCSAHIAVIGCHSQRSTCSFQKHGELQRHAARAWEGVHACLQAQGPQQGGYGVQQQQPGQAMGWGHAGGMVSPSQLAGELSGHVTDWKGRRDIAQQGLFPSLCCGFQLKSHSLCTCSSLSHVHALDG